MSTKNVQFAVAAHIAAVLGHHYGKDVTSTKLAGSVNAEPSFVRRVIAKLSKAGIIHATRGKNGACTLARPPESITLLDIYRASEGPATFSIHDYPIQSACVTSIHIKDCLVDVLEDAQAGFEARLAGHPLSDLVQGVRGMASRACLGTTAGSPA